MRNQKIFFYVSFHESLHLYQIVLKNLIVPYHYLLQNIRSLILRGTWIQALTFEFLQIDNNLFHQLIILFSRKEESYSFFIIVKVEIFSILKAYHTWGASNICTTNTKDI